MKISSSIMAWNESRTIDLALKSIKGFANEVVVFDTGSLDGTTRLAKEWIENLDLSGQVKEVKVKTASDIQKIRLAAWMACSGDWILMQDSTIILSNALKAELNSFAKNFEKYSCDMKSLNLMGDYEHYFANRPFMAYHRTFSERNHPYKMAFRTRPHFIGKNKSAKHYAFNLSRVRPAWRSWYRGELFDRRFYKPGHRNWMGKTNRQYQWLKSGKYSSLIEYVEKVEGKTFEDVKRIAPAWYLRQLQIEATPITADMRKHLPEVLKKELKKPRYKLLKKKGKIIGRWPEL